MPNNKTPGNVEPLTGKLKMGLKMTVMKIDIINHVVKICSFYQIAYRRKHYSVHAQPVCV